MNMQLRQIGLTRERVKTLLSDDTEQASPPIVKLKIKTETMRVMKAESKCLKMSFDEYVSALVEKSFDLREWSQPRWEGKAPYCSNFVRRNK